MGSYDYYSTDMRLTFMPRALMGTIAHLFELSPLGFAMLLQLFKLCWLTLLCFTFREAFKSWFLVIVLAVLFAFSANFFTANADSAMVDVAANFWLLLALLLLVRSGRRKPPAAQFALAILPVCLALLTHEEMLFPIALLCAWVLLRYRWEGIVFAIPVLQLTIVYLWLVWKLTAKGYVAILQEQGLAFFINEGFSLAGVFSAAGTLWIIYFLLGYLIFLRTTDTLRRVEQGFLWLAGIAAAFAPLMIAHDTQRMVWLIWVPLYVLIMDRGGEMAALFRTSFSRMLLVLAVIVHLMIPPIFIYQQRGMPLNCYAAEVMPYISSQFDANWLVLGRLNRPDLGDTNCSTLHLWH